jgi:adenosine deaminase
LLKGHKINPVKTKSEMKKLLILQPEEQGSLLNYLDKFHYPLWITQFYENLTRVTEGIIREAYREGVRLLELRYSPVIHSYAGLTFRQAIRAVLGGMNRAKEQFPDLEAGLIIIAMRQHGPHIAKIVARQAVAEGQFLHRRSGVIGFDIAGAERGNPPGLFREAYDVAEKAGLGLTVHAGEDEGPESIWQAVDDLGISRIAHGCTAVNDKTLLRRLARDRILIECCITSNIQTGVCGSPESHPIFTFLESGIPVAVCTDNTTVSATGQNIENTYLLKRLSSGEIKKIHELAASYTFIHRPEK